jgi:hypothetical protein
MISHTITIKPKTHSTAHESPSTQKKITKEQFPTELAMSPGVGSYVAYKGNTCITGDWAIYYVLGKQTDYDSLEWDYFNNPKFLKLLQCSTLYNTAPKWGHNEYRLLTQEELNEWVVNNDKLQDRVKTFTQSA